MLTLDNPVTIADFIVALEEEEVKELSNLFDPCGNLTDATKIQYALDRAMKMINSRFVISGNCGKALIKLNSCNLVIWIARHLLDTVKSRPHVVDDYNRAVEELEKHSCRECEDNCPLTDGELAEILGEMPPIVDKGFRFNSDCRKWTRKTLRRRQRQLFDHRSVETLTTDPGCCPDDKCCD